MTVTDNSNMPKDRKMTKVTRPKLVKVASNLFDSDINLINFMIEKALVKVSKTALSLKKLI